MTGIYLILFTEFIIKNDLNFLINLPQVKVAGIIVLCDYDDIVSLGEICLVEPVIFSDQTFQPVSPDRITEFFSDSNPQSCNALPVRFKNQGKVSCIEALTRAIQIDKIRPLQYSFRLRKRKGSH